MAISVEKSKFKSAFGEPARVQPKRLHPKALNKARRGKPISFFDSQRINRAQLYQGQLQEHFIAEMDGVQSQNSQEHLVDINAHEAQMNHLEAQANHLQVSEDHHYIQPEA